MSDYTVTVQGDDAIRVVSVGTVGPAGPQGEPGPAGVNTWGDITGTLATQADLQTALDAKVSTSAFANVTRMPLLVVAASDASDEVKALAYRVCDGVDDHIEIQAAIDALGAIGHGVVQLSDGAFSTALALDMRSGITVQGTGWGTVITCTDPHRNIMQTGYPNSLQADHFSVRNLKATGTMLNTEIGAGSAFTNAQNVLIENCDISNVNDICIYIGSGSSDILIRNNVLHDYGNTNVNNGRYGVEVDGFDYSNGLNPPKRVTAIGNHINGYNGMSMSSNGRTISDIIFANNIIAVYGSTGIVVGGGGNPPNMTNRYAVADNLITKTGTGTVVGILIMSGYAGVVKGNTIYGVSSHGIRINAQPSVKDTIISDNVVAFCGGSGLKLEASVYPQFSIVDGLSLEGNAAGVTDLRTDKSNCPIRGVVGQAKSESSGSATIASGSTTIVVPHGLYGAPGVVQVTPSAPLGSAAKWWVSSIGGTNFTINVDVAPGSSVSFQWQARMYA